MAWVRQNVAWGQVGARMRAGAGAWGKARGAARRPGTGGEGHGDAGTASAAGPFALAPCLPRAGWLTGAATGAPAAAGTGAGAAARGVLDLSKIVACVAWMTQGFSKFIKKNTHFGKVSNAYLFRILWWRPGAGGGRVARGAGPKVPHATILRKFDEGEAAAGAGAGAGAPAAAWAGAWAAAKGAAGQGDREGARSGRRRAWEVASESQTH